MIRSVRSLEWIVAHSPFSLYSPRQTGDVGAGETVPSAAKRNAGIPGEIIIVKEPVSAGKASPGLSDLNPEQNALCFTRRSGGSYMLKTAISVGIGGLAVLVGAGVYYRRRSRLRRFLSTSDWVKLMRENDARAAAKKGSDDHRTPEAQT